MKKNEKSKVIKDILDEQDVALSRANMNRAYAVTVGTCFGGVVELSMRKNDGTVTYVPMQPVEVIELIHQLSASVGCHIHIQPRKDFSSWRQWNKDDDTIPLAWAAANHAPISEPPKALEAIEDNFQRPGLEVLKKKRKVKKD